MKIKPLLKSFDSQKQTDNAKLLGPRLIKDLWKPKASEQIPFSCRLREDKKNFWSNIRELQTVQAFSKKCEFSFHDIFLFKKHKRKKVDISSLVKMGTEKQEAVYITTHRGSKEVLVQEVLI